MVLQADRSPSSVVACTRNLSFSLSLHYPFQPLNHDLQILRSRTTLLEFMLGLDKSLLFPTLIRGVVTDRNYHPLEFHQALQHTRHIFNAMEESGIQVLLHPYIKVESLRIKLHVSYVRVLGATYEFPWWDETADTATENLSQTEAGGMCSVKLRSSRAV